MQGKLDSWSGSQQKLLSSCSFCHLQTATGPQGCVWIQHKYCWCWNKFLLEIFGRRHFYGLSKGTYRACQCQVQFCLSVYWRRNSQDFIFSPMDMIIWKTWMENYLQKILLNMSRRNVCIWVRFPLIEWKRKSTVMPLTNVWKKKNNVSKWNRGSFFTL